MIGTQTIVLRIHFIHNSFYRKLKKKFFIEKVHRGTNNYFS